MTELEKLRSLVAGAATAPDRDTALAYIGAARATGRTIKGELKSVFISLEAIEKRVLGANRAEQAPLIPEDP